MLSSLVLKEKIMEIMKSGSQPTKKASSDWFTGTVWQDPIIEAPEPARVRALNVMFEPGARTAWPTRTNFTCGQGYWPCWAKK